MNIKKNKIALVISGLLFLSVPFSNTFAAENQCQMSGTMNVMKSELQGYVKGFKGDDAKKMKQHVNQLLQLSDSAIKEMPEMDHSQMNHDDMAKMDHSQMNHDDMAKMDHSQMNHGDMAEMDHSQMNHGDMSMQGMSDEHHQQMMHMQGLTELNEQFKQLAKTQDKDEIKVIMGQIKEISKQSQLFRKNCY